MTALGPHTLILASSLALAAGSAAPLAADTTASPQAPPEAAANPSPAASAERDAEYRAFRQEFDAGRYNEALPHGERVVVLTEQLDAHHPELASALNNLGATHYRLGDYLAAEQTYDRALRLVEDQHGAMSERLIAPLRGLALTYQGTGRNEYAVMLLERALGISRRTRGLFNPGQRELLAPLADSYVALGRWLDANRTQQYALQVSEHEFGTRDPRLFPALQKIAQWYTNTGQRANARQIWERLLAIARDAKHPDPVGQIIALRGIAETFRLDFQFGAEPVEGPRPGEVPPRRDGIDPESVRRSGSMLGPDYVLASAGLDALEQALVLAEHLQPPSMAAVAIVLVDLGDWHVVSGRHDRALRYYARALPLMPAESGTPESPLNPLSHPSPLLYRPPPVSMRFREQPAAMVVEKYAVAEFTVTDEGRVHDAKIVEGDANESQRAVFLSAISRATYRPRFVDGKPVATEKVRYRETFRHLKH